ncbi:hypothetical protein HY251_05735 [bacterium]|nr:hypothetical protein [bacterium]
MRLGLLQGGVVVVLAVAFAGCGPGGNGSPYSGAPATSSSPSSSGPSSSAPSAPPPPAPPPPSTPPPPPPPPPPPATSPEDPGIVFPADNPWNTDISAFPVHPLSDTYIASIGAAKGLHPDFGSDPLGGIPYVFVKGTQATVPISFTYADESDPGPYPIPSDAPIEGGSAATGDRHVIVLDKDNHKLYEMFNSFPDSTTGGWKCDSGAIFDLMSDALRPDGWTSADAAGLPIFPGLVRYYEAVTKGEIKHALRFTVSKTQKGYIHPATHYASASTSPSLPPMGLRLRLKASVDISGFPSEVKVILLALKKYGMIVADNGSDWFISGAPDSRWSDDSLSKIKTVMGSDFEVVDTGPILTK